MTFTSYAQNQEDVVLWRVLQAFTPGFYIDVGAGDPVLDSVTKAFSDAGWRGVNIEPMKGSYDRLCADRPRDITLNVAAEDAATAKSYFSVNDGNGLSTGDREMAREFERHGFSVDEIIVQTRTLSDICEEFAEGEIHFLKIDAEGAEERVLLGADFSRFRPWVIVIESIAPMIIRDPKTGELRRPVDLPVATHEHWEYLLTAARYEFAMFDGINRYYVAEEHASQLREKLSVPANVLDFAELASHRSEIEAVRQQLDLTHQMMLASHRSEIEAVRQQLDLTHQTMFELSRNVTLLAGYLQSAEENNELLTAEKNSEISEISVLRHELELTKQTVSWRVTRPLRVFRRRFGRRSESTSK